MSCPNLACQGILDEIGAILTDRVADHSIPRHQPRLGGVLRWSNEHSPDPQNCCRRSKEKRDSLARRTVTRRNMRRQDNRFTRLFIAYSEISELSSG